MIMGAASLSIVLAMFTTYLCGRFQAFGAMKIATAGLVLALGSIIALVFFFGEKGEAKSVYVLAYMLCEVIVILPMVLFWGMAVGVLNPTESKKWMGMIGAAGTCGCILAGYTISLVSKEVYVNELSLGLVAAVLLSVSFILLARSKLLTIEDDGPATTESSSILRKLAVLISSRQSVLMTGLVVFSAIVMSLVDINFKFEVRDFYNEKPPAELYDFFGQFYTWTSVAQLILQLLVVRAVLMKGGVWAAISILPALLLLTSVFALFVGDKNAVYVSKFITQVVFFTIEYVGLQMLFLSVTKKMRGQMNSAVDGLTRPATIACISLLITSTLPFWQEDTVFRLNSIIICLCLLWLFVSFLNYRQYLTSLIENLKAKRVSSRPSRDASSEKSSLSQFFSNPSEAVSCFVDQLQQVQGKDWSTQFRKLLVDPDEKFVSPAIRYLAFQGHEQDKQKLLEIGLNGSSAQKTQSLLAFFDTGQKEKLGQLSRLLQDEDKKVRFCCSVLLGSGDGSHATEADEIRDQFLHSRNLDDRMLVIETLSFLQGFDISPCMEKLHSVKNSKLNEEAFESAKHRALSKIFATLRCVVDL